MSKYPEVITASILEQYTHISDITLKIDILDTEREIEEETKKAKGYGLLAMASVSHERKMADFRHSACLTGINDRKELVDFLKRLQKTRVNDT